MRPTSGNRAGGKPSIVVFAVLAFLSLLAVLPCLLVINAVHQERLIGYESTRAGGKERRSVAARAAQSDCRLILLLRPDTDHERSELGLSTLVTSPPKLGVRTAHASGEAAFIVARAEYIYECLREVDGDIDLSLRSPDAMAAAKQRLTAAAEAWDQAEDQEIDLAIRHIERAQDRKKLLVVLVLVTAGLLAAATCATLARRRARARKPTERTS